MHDTCPNDAMDVDHAVVICGYGDDPLYGPYWVVRNSWVSFSTFSITKFYLKINFRVRSGASLDMWELLAVETVVELHQLSQCMRNLFETTSKSVREILDSIKLKKKSFNFSTTLNLASKIFHDVMKKYFVVCHLQKHSCLISEFFQFAEKSEKLKVCVTGKNKFV